MLPLRLDGLIHQVAAEPEVSMAICNLHALAEGARLTLLYVDGFEKLRAKSEWLSPIPIHFPSISHPFPIHFRRFAGRLAPVSCSICVDMCFYFLHNKLVVWLSSKHPGFLETTSGN